MNLDELERLEREATVGPWSSTPSDPSQGYECFWLTACPEINQERQIATVCGPQNERNTSNAAFIAALRNAAPELIAMARLGAIAIRFIDRANDVAECDPAERILSEWANEVNAVLAAMQEQKP